MFAIINLDKNEIFHIDNEKEIFTSDFLLKKGWGLQSKLVCVDVENSTYDLTKYKVIENEEDKQIEVYGVC